MFLEVGFSVELFMYEEDASFSVKQHKLKTYKRGSQHIKILQISQGPIALVLFLDLRRRKRLFTS